MFLKSYETWCISWYSWYYQHSWNSHHSWNFHHHLNHLEIVFPKRCNTYSLFWHPEILNIPDIPDIPKIPTIPEIFIIQITLSLWFRKCMTLGVCLSLWHSQHSRHSWHSGISTIPKAIVYISYHAKSGVPSLKIDRVIAI